VRKRGFFVELESDNAKMPGSSETANFRIGREEKDLACRSRGSYPPWARDGSPKQRINEFNQKEWCA
jgi:hypothetical protein